MWRARIANRKPLTYSSTSPAGKRDGGFGVIGASSRPPSGLRGRGVIGPLGVAGSRDDGVGVMRAPGRGVPRVRDTPGVRDGGGGVYQAFVAATSLGQPTGSHGRNTLVVFRYSP